MMKGMFLSYTLHFDTPEERELSERLLLKIMGLNSLLNLQHLQRYPEEKNLYESGIVYTPPDQNDGRPPLKKKDVSELLALLRRMGTEPETALLVIRVLKGMEIFMDLPALLKRGKGDCNELVPVRVAELWRTGIPSSPYLVKGQENDRGGISYHAAVLHPDGSMEDPSLILGMGGPDRAPDRAEEIRKNTERLDNAVVEGQALVEAGIPSQTVLGRIHAMGLVPSDGTFQSPYHLNAWRGIK